MYYWHRWYGNTKIAQNVVLTFANNDCLYSFVYCYVTINRSQKRL